MIDDIDKALLKKATGYVAKEVVEEYGGESGELLKRKVSKKHIPPDITAIKTLLELKKQNNSLEKLSDEELEKEKIRLLKELKNSKE